MTERPEQHSSSGEQLGKVEIADVEQLNQKLAEQLEVTGQGEAVEAQAERLETARESVERQAEQQRPGYEAPRETATNKPTRLDQLAEYRHTLRSLQRKLSPVSRAFSKVIHNPAVDKTSELLGATILRPSATLGATTTALVVGAFFYLTARRYGFPLRGSEIAVSVIAGGLLGVLIEGISKLIQRARHK